MAKRTLYEINAFSPAQLNGICTGITSDYMDCLRANCMYDRDEEQAAMDLECLCTQLAKAGFSVKPSEDLGTPHCAYVLRTEDEEDLLECKINYFRQRFEYVSDVISRLSLRDFATMDTDMYIIASQISDQQGDRVFYMNRTRTNAMLWTMDKFIRDLEPYASYFIGNRTVIMD